MSTLRILVKTAAGHHRKALLLIVAAVLLFGAATWHYATTPVNPPIPPKIVDIPKGAGFIEITQILYREGLVENRPLFWLLALGKKAEKTIRAGEYELSGSMTPAQIIAKLVRGEIKVYVVRLLEDITVREVVERLLADKLINEKEFMALAADKAFLLSLGIEGGSVEGYLFPDTYRFDRSMLTQELLRALVRQFWKKITPAMKKRAEELGLTMSEWVTLASLIGKEARLQSEKPLVSSVFHNRLKRGMKLQSDPTAVYHPGIMGPSSKTVRREHLRADTPHNTYRIQGLPPGPIANPGLDSLLAAIYPAQTNYLYFVARNDGSHQFSANLEEHRQAVLKYQINKQKN